MCKRVRGKIKESFTKWKGNAEKYIKLSSRFVGKSVEKPPQRCLQTQIQSHDVSSENRGDSLQTVVNETA